MDEIRTYHWKELSLKKEYNEITHDISDPINISDCDFSFILPFLEDVSIINSFVEEYQFSTISNLAKKLIDSLLDKYRIYHLNLEFYVLSAIFQKQYLNYFDSPAIMGKSLYKDFQNERKDLDTLLNILYIKLEKGNDAVKSISFKSDKTSALENFFVVKDILDALIIHYDLTVENFEIRKRELLTNTNSNKLELLDEYQKWLLIKSLFKYVSKEKDSKEKILSKDIRFAGLFIYISQIPINKMHFEINLSSDIDSILSIEDIKYLRTFLKRPKAFFIK